jgi:hypothetical protein
VEAAACGAPSMDRGAAPDKGVAHSPQNLTVGSFAAPHVGHATESGAAHSPQNLRPTVFGLPHFEQITSTLANGSDYLAYSTARVSRMTVTLIWPG